jgi:hypothetical protein
MLAYTALSAGSSPTRLRPEKLLHEQQSGEAGAEWGAWPADVLLASRHELSWIISLLWQRCVCAQAQGAHGAHGPARMQPCELQAVLAAACVKRKANWLALRMSKAQRAQRLFTSAGPQQPLLHKLAPGS